MVTQSRIGTEQGIFLVARDLTICANLAHTDMCPIYFHFLILARHKLYVTCLKLGEIEQNGLPPLPKRDFPETFPAAIESTTHEKSPEQPQAPPRRPKRGPTVIKAPPKPVENEPQKTEGKAVVGVKISFGLV